MHYDVKNLTHQIWSNGIKNYKENLDYLRGLFIIKNLLDTKDHYTYIHSVHVSRYAYLIGRELKLSEKELQELYLTALLHDIGKSEIPTDILLKNDHLTQQEYIEVKKHVFFGAEIVKDYKIYENLSQNILYHHERWDGEGYPLGLKGKEIPLISRIVNLADSFDAMTTVRPYKAGMSLNEALQELRNNANKQFDGKIVKVFNNLILKGKDLENGNEHNEQAG